MGANFGWAEREGEIMKLINDRKKKKNIKKHNQSDLVFHLLINHRI